MKDKVAEDMKRALKSGDKERLSTLRMLLSAIRYAEIEKHKPLADEDVLTTIGRELKKRHEATEEYRKGNRPELADKEQREAGILEAYLPPQLSDGEVRAIVETTIKEVGALGPGDIGKVMSAVMPKVKGKADGKRVNEIAREAITK